MLAIPADAEERQTAVVRIVLDVERTFDGPVMGQVERTPLLVVEAGLFGAGRIAFEETPRLVEGDSTRTAGFDFHFSGGWHDGARQHHKYKNALHYTCTFSRYT